MAADLIDVVDPYRPAVTPWKHATSTRSSPCGVPKSCSNSGSSAGGRYEKMPPPSLSSTTNVAGPDAPSRPFTSCRKHRSPHSPTVVAGAVACATPTTVDTKPSMPLAPRLAMKRTPLRGTMHHSSARTGRLDATTSVAPSGNAAVTSRATRPSNAAPGASSTRSIASRARDSAMMRQSNEKEA